MTASRGIGRGRREHPLKDQHGTIQRYMVRACRCAACREAWRAYHAERRQTVRLLRAARAASR